MLSADYMTGPFPGFLLPVLQLSFNSRLPSESLHFISTDHRGFWSDCSSNYCFSYSVFNSESHLCVFMLSCSGFANPRNAIPLSSPDYDRIADICLCVLRESYFSFELFYVNLDESSCTYLLVCLEMYWSKWLVSFNYASSSSSESSFA